LAADQDFARIGLVEPVENRHQRGFSRAVFPDDAVDRAALNPDRNILVGLYRPECLGNTPQFDCRGTR
jgi:hypothetical protein